MRFWFNMARARSRRRSSNTILIRSLFVPLCILPLLLLQLFVDPSPPVSFSAMPPPLPSSRFPLLLLDSSHFCTGGAHSNCFPRIHGLCISSSQVKICEEASNDPELLETLPIMRFYGERLTLPVVHSRCTGEKKRIDGVVMVADQRYLPYRKPNPHHEAEKLIPASLLHQKLGLRNTTLYWFAKRQDLSQWAAGFLKAMAMDNKVQFLDLPKQEEAALCFEDAIVFSAPTNLWYIPDENSNRWLHELVLQYCSIPTGNSSWPPRTATILDRQGGTRHLENVQLVAEIVKRVLNVSVKHNFSGVGSFCDQVRAVVEDDLLIVPHGSQNTNLIFARPGTVVIEVFPYLYYTDALRNFTHAAGLHVYALLGKRPRRNVLMWFFSLLGWDACYFHLRWCKNYARAQPINVDSQELEKLLLRIVKGLLQDRTQY